MNIKSIINQTNGKFFTVDFIKKDGSTRHMVCRLGVKKYFKGGNKTTPNSVITVFDVVKKQYRCFYPESIVKFKCGSISYQNNQIYIG